MSGIAHLPPLQRVKRYLELAEEARHEARRQNGSARQACFMIADRWLEMAADLSAKLDPGVDPEEAAHLAALLSRSTESKSATKV